MYIIFLDRILLIRLLYFARVSIRKFFISMSLRTCLVALGFFCFAALIDAKGGLKMFRSLSKALNGAASTHLRPALPQIASFHSTSKTLKDDDDVVTKVIYESTRNTLKTKNNVNRNAVDSYNVAPSVDSECHAPPQILNIGNKKYLAFKSGNMAELMNGEDLIQKIIDVGNIAEDEYLDICVGFESELMVLSTLRACLLNPSRKRTLKQFMNAFDSVIKSQLSNAFVAWYFRNLNGSFADEATKDMVLTVITDLQQDIDAPYKGKTALQYALEKFNMEAVDWILQNGGDRLEQYKQSFFAQVRDDVRISEYDLVKLYEVLLKHQLDQTIRFNRNLRQFELL